MRRGVTLLELIIVLTVVGLLALLAVPRIAGWLDRLATQQAVTELMSFYTRARFAAIFRGSRVRLEFDKDSLRAVLEGVRDSTVLAMPGPVRHGVNFHASRRTIRIGPHGFGWGAANTKIVVWRGAAAESLTTSRLGRLKKW